MKTDLELITIKKKSLQKNPTFDIYEKRNRQDDLFYFFVKCYIHKVPLLLCELWRD